MYQPYGGDMRSYRLYRSGGSQLQKLISRREGARLVKRGLAEEGIDLDGVTPCFQLLGAAKKAAACRTGSNVVEEVPLSEPSCVAFSRNELMALAGTGFKHGRSRTARLTEEKKAERVKRIYDETGVRVALDDCVERATNKKREWSKIGGLLAEVKTVERACL